LTRVAKVLGNGLRRGERAVGTEKGNRRGSGVNIDCYIKQNGYNTEVFLKTIGYFSRII
jgi:hypothetical protein